MTPAEDSRLAGEGHGREARTNVVEGSDNGIVPMNHSNKDASGSTESGEGRPLIKENTDQFNTCPTQSGAGVSQGLAGVRKAARENKELKFTALLHRHGEAAAGELLCDEAQSGPRSGWSDVAGI
jgi:hypothetical protein